MTKWPMTRPPLSLAPQDTGIQKVSPAELFMDLIFVFTVSQLSGLIAHPHGAADYVQAGFVFLSLIWIYDGFAWLTSNKQEVDDLEGWLMFAAMLGFLLMALAIPTVAGSGGALFGLGLMLTTAIHAFLFSRTGNSSARAIAQIAPYNLLSALLVFYAGFTPPPWSLAVWALALGVIGLAIRRGPETQFSLSPRHFVERHGLLIIIALGEMIMGMGLGAREIRLTPLVVAYVTLGLLLAVHTWWSYFGPDNARVEHRMVGATPAERGLLAFRGFGLGHFAMLSGIILAAAALEVGIHHPGHPVPAFTAWNLAVGLSVYFLGDVYFRRVMGVGPGRLRLLVALLLLLTVPLGSHVSALAQLLTCVVIVIGAIAVEDYVLEPKRALGEH